MSDAPRVINPVVNLFDPSKNMLNFKDFSPKPQKVVTRPVEAVVVPDEVSEAEEAMTPAPKDESVAESADYGDLLDLIAQEGSETPAPLDAPIPTRVTPTVAETESGKDSELNEDESETPSPSAPKPESSSPSSSSKTSPGSSVPPVPVVPPTFVPTQS